MRKRHPVERLISRPTNCQAERSNAERAIRKLHSTSQAGEIRKKAKPVREAGSQLIADMQITVKARVGGLNIFAFTVRLGSKLAL